MAAASTKDPSAEILALVASARAQTRVGLMAATGLSRSTITRHLQHLVDTEVVSEQGKAVSSGGRPAGLFTLNQTSGIAVGVDVGEDHTRVALTDLGNQVLAESVGTTDLEIGPEAVLNWVTGEITLLLEQIGRSSHDLVGICLGLPAPVDWKTGRVVGPSVMPGWDDYDVAGAINLVHAAPVVVDNDVNLLGLAEARRQQPDAEYLFYVKAGTGIGGAIVTNGELYRGSRGAAGYIGHVHLASSSSPLCRCGSVGCVEATAGGWAIARDLRAVGIPAVTARDVARLAGEGEPEAIRGLRDAGRALGESVAAAVNLLNPDVLVLGGVLAGAGDYLLTGVREIVYRRALPLCTTNLRIETSRLGDHAGVLGAAQLVIDRVIRPVS